MSSSQALGASVLGLLLSTSAVKGQTAAHYRDFHLGANRVAYWNRFSRPAITPKYDLGFDSWWIDQKKDQALTQRGRS